MGVHHDHPLEVAAALDVHVGVPLGQGHQQVLQRLERESHLPVLDGALDLAILLPGLRGEARLDVDDEALTVGLVVLHLDVDLIKVGVLGNFLEGLDAVKERVAVHDVGLEHNRSESLATSPALYLRGLLEGIFDPPQDLDALL